MPRLLIQKCIFFFLLTFSSWAAQDIHESQLINLIDVKKHIFYRLNLKTNTCIEFHSNGEQTSTSIHFENVKPDDLPPGLASNYFQISPDKFLITLQGTGQTYLFNTQNYLLSRIDKTYFRGYNFLPIQFIRQDTLISLGGTGFWRNHNIATFFHKPLYEWELYGNIGEDGPEAVSAQFGGYYPLKDQIYCLGQPKLYTEKKDLNYPFYCFDFKSRKWKELGLVDFKRQELKSFNKMASQWISPYFFSYEISLGEFIDPIKNIIYRYDGKNIAFFHLSTQVYFKGNYIYSFLRTYNRNEFDIKLDSMTIDQLKKNSVVIGRFYTPKIWYNEINWTFAAYCTTLLVLIGLIISIIRLIRKKYRRELESWNHLPEQGELFLHYLCDQQDHTCTTEKLNEILQCEGKTIESQRQSRSKFISSINLFFERNYGCHEAIQRLQAESDKRYVNYVISQEAVNIFTKKI